MASRVLYVRHPTGQEAWSAPQAGACSIGELPPAPTAVMDKNDRLSATWEVWPRPRPPLQNCALRFCKRDFKGGRGGGNGRTGHPCASESRLVPGVTDERGPARAHDSLTVCLGAASERPRRRPPGLRPEPAPTPHSHALPPRPALRGRVPPQPLGRRAGHVACQARSTPSPERRWPLGARLSGASPGCACAPSTKPARRPRGWAPPPGTPWGRPGARGPGSGQVPSDRVGRGPVRLCTHAPLNSKLKKNVTGQETAGNTFFLLLNKGPCVFIWHRGL